ncbi:nuclear RNA export factor 2-like [Trichechus manatus latirostris]|uniref:Nuclear RNA export factor 2-like n=1 Tax=Trichechus manatus latirostris TaxID=127582 RepID=A0A2Y9E882_TRIMA|nr:nuclear RNA export factor 2-like [Trichechus manatus latirostris]
MYQPVEYVTRTHYASRPYYRGGQRHYQGQFHANMDMWKEKIHPGRKTLGRGQNGIPQSWFKITIPCGRKYDKTWLLNSIQSHCRVPFSPVDFYYARMQAQFFVQDASTAAALKNVSYKIRDDENQKICIFVNPSSVPYSVQTKLRPEQVDQLKLTMNKRYDVSQQALDLQNLRFDPNLVDHDIDMILNRRNCMAATLKIIEENFPELLSLNLRSNKLYQLDGLSDIMQKAPKVKILNLSKNELKSAWELDKIRGLKLEELWLVEGVCQAHVCAFTRIFIATPASNSRAHSSSSLCIVNDQLCVRDVSLIETQGAFSTLVPIPSSSSVPTVSQEQQEVVQAFSTQSGMNLQWPQKCLHDNSWDYTRASQIFTLSTVRAEASTGEGTRPGFLWSVDGSKS